MTIDSESDEYAALMKASKDLFGNQDRLLVGAAVALAEPGNLYGQALSRATGLVQPRVGAQLKAFAAAGLLVKMPLLGGGQRVLYQRRPSVFWDFVPSLLAEIAPSMQIAEPTETGAHS